MESLRNIAAWNDDDFKQLKQQLDSYAVNGKALFYQNCQLPLGCYPEYTTVWFFQEKGTHYGIRIVEPVQYRGPNIKIAEFFYKGTFIFGKFEEFVTFLKSLNDQDFQRNFLRTDEFLQIEFHFPKFEDGNVTEID
jgi:hypothetical protein